MSEPCNSNLTDNGNDVEENLNTTPTGVAILAASGSGMKMTFKKPKRPPYVETKSTPLELIQIKGNISKCKGCGKPLKKGPDPVLVSEYDKVICVRHKERDHFFDHDKNFWRNTFSNVHYHVFLACIEERNRSFVSENLVIGVPIDNRMRNFVMERLGTAAEYEVNI